MSYDNSRLEYIKKLCDKALSTPIEQKSKCSGDDCCERSMIIHEIFIYCEQIKDFYKREGVY